MHWRWLLFLTVLTTGVQAGIQPRKCDPDMSYQGPARAGSLAADLLPNQAFADQPMPQDVAARLEARFQELIPLTEATAGTIAIWHPTLGRWAERIGNGEAPFWWASVAKLYTATIIWRLVERNELGLNDTIDQWLPDYPGASLISVNHLLTHTGGVFSFNADRKFREETAYATPDRLMKIAARHHFDFCPGTDWHYSNTGYVMLARIAEEITGASFADLIKKEIAEPLGLSSTGLATPSAVVVPGFDSNGHTSAQIATTFGAGGILSDAVDMVTFLHAWLSGRLVSAASRDAAFAERYAMFGQMESYGRGVMVIPVPDPEFTTIWIGHTGGAPGAKAVLVFDTKRQVFVAVAINRQAAAEAIANNMLKALDDLPAPPAERSADSAPD